MQSTHVGNVTVCHDHDRLSTTAHRYVSRPGTVQVPRREISVHTRDVGTSKDSNHLSTRPQAATLNSQRPITAFNYPSGVRTTPEVARNFKNRYGAVQNERSNHPRAPTSNVQGVACAWRKEVTPSTSARRGATSERAIQTLDVIGNTLLTCVPTGAQPPKRNPTMPVRNCAHGITQRTFIGSYIAQSTTSQRQRQKEQQHLRDGDDGGHNQTGNYAVAYRKAFLHNRKTVVGVKGGWDRTQRNQLSVASAAWYAPSQ